MTNSDKKEQKEPKIYVCNICDYNTCKKNNFNRHLSTQKHKFLSNSDKIVTNSDKKEQKEPKIEFKCVCGKKYKYRQGLSLHKSKCRFIENNKSIIEFDNKELMNLKENNRELKNLVKELIQENSKQQEQISELIPKVGNNNNTINNKFNINVFLNEQCKDAINMSDFINSLSINLEHLDYTKENGLANGLSKTIIENINKLSLYERPLHCTDTKREILYIKDNNAWEKDKDKTKIKKVIKDTSNKQFKILQYWKDENPDFKEIDEKQDYFARTVSIIGKPTESIDEKVIKKICSNTYLKGSLDE